jgi:hypothetical protein
MRSFIILLLLSTSAIAQTITPDPALQWTEWQLSVAQKACSMQLAALQNRIRELERKAAEKPEEPK